MNKDTQYCNHRAAGLKDTPQRRAVYSAMLELKHASADELTTLLAERGFAMPPSTIYRTLETFERAGLLSTFRHPATGRLYYDITTEAHHHLLHDTEISDYEDAGLTQIIKNHLISRGIEESKIGHVRVAIQINGGNLLLI